MATLDAGTLTRVARGWTIGRKIGARLIGLFSFLVFLAIWQAIVWISDANPLLLPGPSAVVQQLGHVAANGMLGRAAAESAQPLFAGLASAILVGVIGGLLIGASRWADLITFPYLYGLFATPRIAMAPLFVLWFGLGFEAKFWLVFLSTLLPVMLSSKEGVLTVDDSLIRAARAFGAKKIDVFKRVVIPFTLPFIANGVRNGIARGFVGLLVVELIVGSGGIGREIVRATRQFNTARVFAFVAVLMFVALLLISLSRRLEAFASRWREEVYL
jgi:ABC-type nitrate/sulfonate/bicarbonate transport system permease component